MAVSYNGWPANKDKKAVGVVKLVVAGVELVGGVKSGDVATVLGYVAEQFNLRVERLVNPGCWGYNYRQNRNANNLSCHSSGTAIDLNAPKHPNKKSGTFTAAQVKVIRAILAEVGGVVRWGGDFSSTKDEMHFEIKADYRAVAKVAARIRTARQITKEAVMAAVDEQLPQGNHYSKEPESLGWAVREMEPRIVGQVVNALAKLEARLADTISKAVVDRLLATELAVPTWRDGQTPVEQTQVRYALARAAEASITRHREELTPVEKLVQEATK